MNTSIIRDLLVGAFRSSRAPLTLIAAPAGYGKSVLALQLAQSVAESVIWVSLGGSPLDPSRLVARICGQLRVNGECRLDESGQYCLLTENALCVGGAARRPICLVLDDLSADDDPAELRAVLEQTMSFGLAPDFTIITTRADSLQWIERLRPGLVFGASQLSYLDSEIIAAVASYGSHSLQEDQVRAIHAVSKGHPATVSVLARHVSLGNPLDGQSPTADLSVYLAALARSQLSRGQLETLCAASLLSVAPIECLESALGRSVRDDLDVLELRIPLFQSDASCVRRGFSVHDLAAAVYSSRQFIAGVGLSYDEMLAKAVRALESGGSLDRAFRLVGQVDDLSMAADLLIRRGSEMVALGGLVVVESMLSTIPARTALLYPRLLLLHAEVLREHMLFDDALAKARVACDLAAIEDDSSALSQALMMLARLQMDRGLIEDSARNLQRICELSGVDREVLTCAHAYLSLCCSFEGDQSRAATEARKASELAQSGVSSATQVKVLTSLATVSAVLTGEWSSALEVMMRAREMGEIPIALDVQVHGNIGTAYVELGRLERAEKHLQRAVDVSKAAGLRMLELSFTDSLALLSAARMQYEVADSLMEMASEGCVEREDHTEAARQFTYWSMILRAQGRYDKALDAAERAMEEAACTGFGWLRWGANLEVAACLLAQADAETAVKQIQWVRGEAARDGARRYVWIADLMLSISEFRAGLTESALARLEEHRGELSSGDGNYVLAMYARAFPEVLSLILLYPEIGNPRLITMVPVESLRLAAKMSSAAGLQLSAQRLAAFAAERTRAKPSATVACRVRLFGGLDVSVGDRVVREKDWRKRKARTLFAMMVLQQGRDLPREQVCEHLWPDMDEERARNNFYVIWSAMKGAVAPGCGRSEPFPYADNSGGLCRISSELVSSDVGEFDRLLKCARRAESRDDPAAAVEAYAQLAELYRGDLLSGDVYDDWYTSARDRYRREFCDAMLRCAALLEMSGDAPRALQLVRVALEHDPWREDLYQAALRCQIATGQRTAAVETYFTCRSRLAEELGLDPSSETLRLYEQVLAMEDGGEPVSGE